MSCPRLEVPLQILDTLEHSVRTLGRLRSERKLMLDRQHNLYAIPLNVIDHHASTSTLFTDHSLFFSREQNANERMNRQATGVKYLTPEAELKCSWACSLFQSPGSIDVDLNCYI